MAFITRKEASTILLGGSIISDNKFCTKKEIIDTNLAKPLDGYNNIDFVDKADVLKKPTEDYILTYNNFISSNNYIGLIGTTPDPNDVRIPFMYTNSSLSIRRCGYIDENNLVHTFNLNASSYGVTVNNIVKNCVLLENYLFGHIGDGKKGKIYLFILNIDTGAIEWSNGSSYKYIHSPNWGEVKDGKICFYTDINVSYYKILKIYKSNGSWNVTEYNDHAFNNVSISRLFIGLKPGSTDNYNYCILYDVKNFNKGWLVKQSADNDLVNITISPTTIKMLLYNSLLLYLSPLRSPQYAAALVDPSDWNHVLIDYNGQVQNRINLLNDSNNKKLLIYKNGKYYYTTIWEVGSKYYKVNI